MINKKLDFSKIFNPKQIEYLNRIWNKTPNNEYVEYLLRNTFIVLLFNFVMFNFVLYYSINNNITFLVDCCVYWSVFVLVIGLIMIVGNASKIFLWKSGTYDKEKMEQLFLNKTMIVNIYNNIYKYIFGALQIAVFLFIFNMPYLSIGYAIYYIFLNRSENKQKKVVEELLA